MTDSLPIPFLTVEEYLRFEEESPLRHEYVAGDIRPMMGTTLRHNRIVQNIAWRLAAASRGGPCQVFLEAIMLRVARDVYYYPDAMVLCRLLNDTDLMVDDPCVVVEVTSPSTRSTDRKEKLLAYRGLPAVRAYLIVEQRRRLVERHWRDADGDWQHETVRAEGRVPIPCPEAELTLDEIYEGVSAALAEPEPEEYDAATVFAMQPAEFLARFGPDA